MIVRQVSIGLSLENQDPFGLASYKTSFGIANRYQ